MNGLTARFLAGAGLVVAALIVFAVLITGGNHATRVRMVMPTALGLRDGSDVRVGGVSVGRVEHLKFTPSDQVEIDLSFKGNEPVHMGNDASATIKSVNLLGEKYVALNPGTAVADAPRVTTIPADRVTTATDLDQVLDVLDADTRTRLAVLINEAGIGLTGRHADFNALLEKLPPSLDTATRLLNQVVSDNHTLASLITHSDRFLRRTVAQRADLQSFVHSAAGAAATFASRQADLKQTLAKAPAGLSALHGLLTNLQATAAPLGPAARNLSATAPQLASTLHELGPFRTAAHPLLDQAVKVAPSLTRLGTEATPVIHESNPTLAALSSFASRSQPLTKALGATGMPDLLGILEGWGRAIQGRDARGHAFHGGVTFGAGVLQSLLQPPAAPQPRVKASPDRAVKNTLAAAPAPQKKIVVPHVPLLPNIQQTLKDLPQQLGKTVQGVTKGLTDRVLPGLKSGLGDRLAPRSANRQTKSLLDYLLGP